MIFESFVINLDEDVDRMTAVSGELAAQNIQFTRFPAIKHEVHWLGHCETIINLFREKQNVEALLVFEDDIYFESPFDPTVFDELPEDFDALYLGANLLCEHSRRYSARLNHLFDGYCTHAVLYSHKLRQKMIERYELGKYVTDFILKEDVQPSGDCYIINPMICFQKNGYSHAHCNYLDFAQTWIDSKNFLK